MSKLSAIVTDIVQVANLTLVTFDCEGHILTMVSLDLDEKIQIGSRCVLGVNPTHIAIGKAFIGMLSYANQLPVTIAQMEQGQILSSLNLAFGNMVLESLITTASVKRMDLRVGEVVHAFIKANELSILEVHS